MNIQGIYSSDKYNGIDDGFYALLRMIEVLSKTDKKASELLNGINKYYSTDEVSLKTNVTDDNKFNIVEDVIEYAKKKKYEYNLIDGIRVTFDDGWALVRASNTSPSLTIRYEAKTKKRLDEIEKEFRKVLEKERN